MSVLHKHMLMDQQPSVFSLVNREKAREALVRWDSGERVKRAALRKAAPVVGSYLVRDIVSYCTELRAGEHGLQKSVGSGLNGFEKDKNSLGETQLRACWEICDPVPVCVAIDHLRPCTPAKFLTFHHTQTKIHDLLQQMPRHNKVSLMNALHLSFQQILTHHELPKMNETTKCQSRHK